MWLFEHFREATKKIMTPPPRKKGFYYIKFVITTGNTLGETEDAESH